jgi:hypothetical protein
MAEIDKLSYSTNAGATSRPTSSMGGSIPSSSSFCTSAALASSASFALRSASLRTHPVCASVLVYPLDVFLTLILPSASPERKLTEPGRKSSCTQQTVDPTQPSEPGISTSTSQTLTALRLDMVRLTSSCRCSDERRYSEPTLHAAAPTIAYNCPRFM